MNHGLETYYWSCRSFAKRFLISIHEEDGGGGDSGIFQVDDHSRNLVSYQKSLRFPALESLDALKMHCSTMCGRIKGTYIQFSNCHITNGWKIIERATLTFAKLSLL